MGYEIEVKFRVADHADLERRLASRGVVPEGTVEHRDAYLAHPSRDFASTGEAFRIRGEGASQPDHLQGGRSSAGRPRPARRSRSSSPKGSRLASS